MNQQDGQLELALEFPQIREQRGDLGGVVFIDPVQPDQRVQDQQDGAGVAGRCGRGASGRCGVSNRSEGAVMTCTGNEAKGTCAAAAMPSRRWRTTASESSAGKSSTGPLRRTGNWRKQAAPGSDTDGHIQSQEAFAAFGFAAQDADGLLGPEILDQPLGLRTAAGQLAGPLNREVGSWLFGGLGIQGKDLEVEFFVDAARVPVGRRRPTGRWPGS